MANYLTTQQAAERIGITRQAVLKAISAGHLKAKKFGRDYQISEASVERYVKTARKPGPKPRR